MQPHHAAAVALPPTPAFRKQTQISSVYTQLSSIKPTGLPKHANACKTVRTTHIGNSYPATKGPRTISNHKSSPELRTVRTTCVGQSTAPSLAATPLTNGHHWSLLTFYQYFNFFFFFFYANENFLYKSSFFLYHKHRVIPFHANQIQIIVIQNRKSEPRWNLRS